MNVLHVIYDDSIIAVALVRASTSAGASSLAMKWLKPGLMKKDGRVIETTNVMGGETAWFILPQTFGAAIGRTLVEQQVAGLKGFSDEGYTAMVKWLIDDEELQDAMCY